MRIANIGRRNLVSNLLLVASVALLAGCGAGCVSNDGTVGQTVKLTDDGSSSTNGPPVTLNVRTPAGAITNADGSVVLDKAGGPVVPVESVSTTATGPSGYAVTTDAETRWLANNQVMRNIFMRSDGAGRWVMNSSTGTDVRVTAEKIEFNPSTGELKGSGFRFETIASEPFKASNASLDALRDWYLTQTDAQKAVFVEQMQQQAAAIRESMPTVADAITKVLEAVVAK